MATQVFTEVPFCGYSYHDELPVCIHRDGGPWEERRTPLADISRRRYSLPFGRQNSERQTIDAFLVRARQLQYEAFYIQDPRDDGLTDVSLGAGDGSTVTFSLPTTGENRRYFPIASGLVVKVSGSPVTVDSVSVDGRTVTLHSAPANAASITITCSVYRLVRIDDGFSWTVEDANWATTSISLVEVVSATG